MDINSYKKIAIFDFDGTLLRVDITIFAAKFFNNIFSFFLKSFLFLPKLFFWKLGIIKTKTIKQMFLRDFKICSFFNKNNKELIDLFFIKIINKINPEALARINWHKKNGDRIILCSASPDMLLKPIAKYLNVELISTNLRKIDNKWYPELVSENCNGMEKVIRLKEYIKNINQHVIEAYGDSDGDDEILKFAQISHNKNFYSDSPKNNEFPLMSILLIFTISIAIYSILFYWSKADQFISIFNQLSSEIIIGLILILIGYFIRFLRWRFLLSYLNQSPPFLIDLRIWMSSFAFTVTPGKSGEFVRSIFLKNNCNIPISDTLSALLVERFSDATSVIALILINLPIFSKLYASALMPFGIIIIILSGFILFIKSNSGKIIMYKFLKKILPKRFKYQSEKCFDKFLFLINPNLLFKATVLGSLAWSLEGLSLWILIKGLNFENIKLGGAILSHTAAGLLGAISMLPGGIGSTEFGTVTSLILQGMDFNEASSVTILIRFMTLWFATFLGICLIFSVSNKKFDNIN